MIKISFFHLNGRAGEGSIRTKYTTIAFFWPDQLVAPGAFVKELTGIGGHGFFLLKATVRTGNDGLIYDFHNNFNGGFKSRVNPQIGFTSRVDLFSNSACLSAINISHFNLNSRSSPVISSSLTGFSSRGSFEIR